jgi:hypothetical protein
MGAKSKNTTATETKGQNQTAQNSKMSRNLAKRQGPCRYGSNSLSDFQEGMVSPWSRCATPSRGRPEEVTPHSQYCRSPRSSTRVRKTRAKVSASAPPCASLSEVPSTFQGGKPCQILFSTGQCAHQRKTRIPIVSMAIFMTFATPVLA